MTRPSMMLTATAAMFVLSACGGGAPKADGPAASATTTASSNFNALDACATLPKEKVATITGRAIASAKLSAVTPATDSTPGFSTCTYVFAGGGTIGFYARQTPGDGNTPDLIAMTRKALVDGMGAKVSDTTGLGTTAFTAQPMDQLHVFFGSDKYIYFMANDVPAGKPILDAERELAAAVIG